MNIKIKLRLGEFLVRNGYLTSEQLDNTLTQQKLTGEKLGYTVIKLGYLNEEQVLTAISEHLEIEYVDLNKTKLSEEVVHLLSEGQSKRFKAIVIESDNNNAVVGMVDPADLQNRDHIENILSPLNISIVLIKESQLNLALQKYFRKAGDIAAIAGILLEEYGVDGFDTNHDDEELANQSTVVRLLNSIFEDAIRMRASDIHIEPDSKVLRIRQRIDGDLQENIIKEVNITAALILRLKLMAGLNISEKRLPQDGRFHIKINQVGLDVRISTMPIKHGESVVMRLLQQGASTIDIKKSGMPEDILTRTLNQLKQKQGMILITGPTGSGKTTTLYGMLNELNSVQKKIITVEDPIEYEISRINQVQINHKIGLNFATVLRTTLRQDPDVIMVGEMRDSETAEIGLRGALTGHLVLSTLHTNDAISSALRLIDMGAEGYLVGSSLKLVIAQRLVKKICSNCIDTYYPNDNEISWLNSFGINQEQYQQIRKGKGCSNCNDTGYAGRAGIYELLEIDDSMTKALRNNSAEEFTEAAKLSPNFIPMSRSAIQYILNGVTTLEEVMTLVPCGSTSSTETKLVAVV